MNDYNPYRSGSSGPGWLAVVVISLFTSCVVAGAVQWAAASGMLTFAPGASSAASSQAKAPRESPGSHVKVPSVVGLPASVAGELLEARGLRLVVRDRQEHATYPEQVVIAQEPLAESSVPSESPVSVVVSSGKSPEIAMPDLVGKSFEEATQALETVGLLLGEIKGPTTGARVVEQTDPPPLRAVAAGSAIALVLVPAGVEVPKLVGLPWGKAKKLIEEAGFKPGKVRERYDDYREAWVVLEQVPEPGARLPAGSSIDIVRNEGE